MICPKCGAKVNEGDNFCEECGASIKYETEAKGQDIKPFPESSAVVHDRNLAAVTNIGRRHPTNEDACTVFKLQNGESVLIAADGVSTSFVAKSASKTAIDVIKEALVKSDKVDRETIISAIHAADSCIKELPYESREDGIYGPEATVVIAVVKNDTVTIGWVGDSRAYILDGSTQELITVDDSWVEMVVAEGSMTREEAVLDKRAHYVTQVLGMHDQEIDIHIIEHGVKPGNMLLLCSDGLWNYFQGENALLKAVETFGINSDASYICEYLVGLANSAGGHDNITAALLRIQ